jgi:tetratricopeptide (TPR) repeat protein
MTNKKGAMATAEPSTSPPSLELDFFISRRGGAAAAAQEVATVLREEGYSVFVQDHDIGHGADFIAAIHIALQCCRHMIVLLTKDYTNSQFTMIEVTNFLASAGQSVRERRLVVLRLDETQPEGILASRVFGDLAGVDDPAERRRRIVAAAEGRATATQRRPKLFENVPPRDLNFLGRDQALAEIRQLLMTGDVTCAAIHGLGGSGKSSLAAEYAHRHGGEHSGVWWAAAEQRTLLISSLASLAGRLDPRLASEPDQFKAARAGLTRLAEFATPFLLVYDNVENPEVVRDLVPATGARVLMTTRWSDWAGRASEVRLDLLHAEDGARFLQARAGRTDAPGAARLAAALGCLPLALDHAGAYCRMAGANMTFDAYLQKIDARITRAPRGYPDSVARTFGLAIEKAAAEHPQAEMLLGIFAFLAPEQIPLDLIGEDLIDEDDRIEALSVLSAVSLIDHQTSEDGSPSVDVHRLVQAAMRSLLASQNRTAGILETVLHALAAAMPERAYDQRGHWPRCARLLPHVLAIHEHAVTGVRSTDLALLCDRTGEFLYARGSLELARTFFQRAVEVGKDAFGPRHVEVAKAANNLAIALHDIGRNADSEPLLREALDIQREQSGVEHWGYARTLTNLARVVHGNGRPDEGETMLREAIALGERTLGRAHPDVTMRLNYLAMLLQGKGQLVEAEALFREAVQLGEQSLGRGHPQVLSPLTNLAFCLLGRGEASEAETLFREAIASGESAFGPDHPHLAICLQNLANVLRDSARTTEAEVLYRRALTILVQGIENDRLSTARVRCNLAKLLLATGRSDEALDLARAAFAVQAQALGSDHPWTRDSAAILESNRETQDQHSIAALPPDHVNGQAGGLKSGE